MSAHLYFKGKTFRFRVEAFCAIHCTICRCQHTSTSKGKPSDSEWKPSVPYIVQLVGVSTPILQRGNLRTQSGNLVCCTLSVTAHQYLKEEILSIVHCGCHCQHTCTAKRKPYVLYIVGVGKPILKSGILTRCTSTLWV